MPKFAVRSNLDLSGVLASGGMPDAFADTADFSGITTAERLKIQTVRHETFVQADEHGTTAAAASGAGAQVTSAPTGVTVTIDHPFLFVITDTSTGAPLFLGKVTDPSAQS
jgi:serpin B